MRYTKAWIMAGLLACSSVAAAAQAQKPAAPAAGGEQAAVISGGIGSNARDELAAKARDYNLKLVFALTSREYLSDVDVEISSAAGRKVATHRAEGPWMYAQLPPGSYTVRATINGSSLTKKVTVGKQGQKVVNFLWPASAGVTGTTEGTAAR
jgi:hypothetical protein